MEKVDEEISFNFSRQGADTVITNNNDVPSDGETTLDYTLSNMDITSNAFDSSVTQNDTVHDNTFFFREKSICTYRAEISEFFTINPVPLKYKRKTMYPVNNTSDTQGQGPI